MQAYERFLNYAKVYTTSDETTGTVPSTERQKVLAEMLVSEMREMGIADAHMDDHGYVYGHIPAKDCAATLRLGFIAHMDTAPDFCGEGVKPILHKNYNGGVSCARGLHPSGQCQGYDGQCGTGRHGDKQRAPGNGNPGAYGGI